jgi:opacity protein-like surface antigen
MRRSFIGFFCILLTVATVSHAQVVPSATSRQFSVSAGGMGSVFQPDYMGDWKLSGSVYNPVAASSDYPLIGIGAYVDVRFTRWIQIEAEGRWMRFNTYSNIHQDNYLIGPRIPIHRYGRFTPYAKALVGITSMDMGPHPTCGVICKVPDPTGRFLTVAYGGGVDMKLTRKFTLRAVDAEYQQMPSCFGSSVSPYGASVGVSYKIF